MFRVTTYKPLLLALSLSILFTQFGFLNDAEAGVVLKKVENYYPVTGKNGAQIFKSFAATKRKLRNKHLFGGNYSIASTDFKIEIGEVNKINKGGYCRITDAEIILNVEYTYPNWVDENSANSSVKYEWSKFMNYVTWHENQHVELAKEFVGEYIALLRRTKFPLLTNCTSLPKEVRNHKNKLHKAHLRKQKLFDRKEGGFSGLGRKHLLALKRSK